MGGRRRRREKGEGEEMIEGRRDERDERRKGEVEVKRRERR